MLTGNSGAIDWVRELGIWNEDFTSQIPPEEFPLLAILKNPYQTVQKRYGIYSKADGNKQVLEVRGKPLWKQTASTQSELLASLIILLDQTDSANAESDLRQAGKTKSAFMLNVGLGLRA